MPQSNQSVKVTAGKHKGRAGRVLSAYPYSAPGAKAGAPEVCDVILDADDEHEHTDATISVDQLEVL